MFGKFRPALVAGSALALVAMFTGTASATTWNHDDHHSRTGQVSDQESHRFDRDHHQDRDHNQDRDDGFFGFFGVFRDSLRPVPHDPQASGHSHTTARSTLVRVGDFVLVVEHVEGAAPGLVHAQHLHGIANHECPGIGRDTDHDGLINTSEGAVDYGPIVVSLTTAGDTSPGSGLAVSRFPVADRNGSYTYARLLRVGTDIPRSVADHLSSFHIVVHGIDTNHNGMYDFSKGPSDLDPSLPQEATVPAACGLIH